jgi:hypothetical protein
LHLREDTEEMRLWRGDDRVTDMFVMRNRVTLRMMGGIIIPEEQSAADILPVVAITEPSQLAFLDDKRFAAFEQGLINQA